MAKSRPLSGGAVGHGAAHGRIRAAVCRRLGRAPPVADRPRQCTTIGRSPVIAMRINGIGWAVRPPLTHRRLSGSGASAGRAAVPGR